MDINTYIDHILGLVQRSSIPKVRALLERKLTIEQRRLMYNVMFRRKDIPEFIVRGLFSDNIDEEFSDLERSFGMLPRAEEYEVRCPICGMYFYTNRQLFDHVGRVHPMRI